MLFTKKPSREELLKDEAHYRLYYLLTQRVCRPDDADYLIKHKLAWVNMRGSVQFDGDGLWKMKPGELVAFARKYTLTPEEWEKGLNTQYANNRMLIRACYDLEGIEY